MTCSRKPKSSDMAASNLSNPCPGQTVSNTSTFSKLVVVCAFTTTAVVMTAVYLSLNSLPITTVPDHGFLVDRNNLDVLQISRVNSIFELIGSLNTTGEPEVKTSDNSTPDNEGKIVSSHYFRLDNDSSDDGNDFSPQSFKPDNSTSDVDNAGPNHDNLPSDNNISDQDSSISPQNHRSDNYTFQKPEDRNSTVSESLEISSGTHTVVANNANDSVVLDVPDFSEPEVSADDAIPTQKDHGKNFFLTACTMVKNEVPYIVEWIEFNRIQGVDRFIIYDGDSSDNVMYLNQFYQQEDPGSHVHVLKSLDANVHEKQRLNFQHCLDTYGNSTEWMMNVDVDEFLHSPAFGTLESLLRNMSEIGLERNLTFNTLVSHNVNFGSSGQQFRFENALARKEDGSIAHQNGCGPQLITDHIRRGPAAVFKEEAAAYHAMTDGLWICSLPGLFSPCRHNPGKTIFRPLDVEIAGIHQPVKLRRRGSAIPWTPPLLVGNHYYYRSREDVRLKAAQWRGGLGLPAHFRNYNLTDSLLWNRTTDDLLRRRWGEELARRVARLTRYYEGTCANGVDRGAT